MEHIVFNMFKTDSFVGIITLEGNIGAGKSTLLKDFKSKFPETISVSLDLDDETISEEIRLIYVDEPLHQWTKKETTSSFYDFKNGKPFVLEKSILEYLYENPKDFAFTFQVNAFCTRVKAMTDAIDRSVSDHPNGKFILVMERSILSDRWFMKLHTESGNIHPLHTIVYDNFYDLVARRTENKIKGILYVSTPPHICHIRMKKRARLGEEEVSLDYLGKVHDAHQDMLKYAMFTNKALIMDDGFGNGALALELLVRDVVIAYMSEMRTKK